MNMGGMRWRSLTQSFVAYNCSPPHGPILTEIP
jgi:hypothetical protein